MWVSKIAWNSAESTQYWMLVVGDYLFNCQRYQVLKMGRKERSVLMHECGVLQERFLPIRHMVMLEEIFNSSFSSSAPIFVVLYQRALFSEILLTASYKNLLTTHRWSSSRYTGKEEPWAFGVGTCKFERIFQLLFSAILFVCTVTARFVCFTYERSVGR